MIKRLIDRMNHSQCLLKLNCIRLGQNVCINLITNIFQNWRMEL